MQDSLFSEPEAIDPAPRQRAKPAKVQPARTFELQAALSRALPQNLRMGTSSWSYPGWIGTVWDREYPEARLSKHGLSAYAQHPLFWAVSLDRAFYRPLTASQYAAYAAQVPEDFRFVVKAPSLIADAMMRSESGRGTQPNPAFLNPELAVEQFVQPALAGLGQRVGALVFQLSPLPAHLLQHLPDVIRSIGSMLRALPSLRPAAPDGVIAVEVRDPGFLTPAFAEVLRETGATYCIGLHAKMPPINEQLPMLRALWPGPLVCRWNLHRRHGAFGYEEAKRLYGAFDRLVDPDEETRTALARVIAGTTGAGHLAYVTIGNKAEGSAPLSVVALAEALEGLGRLGA
ncbi:MAG: DUF72 domain-containing protein [Panacagrimonas sp.]